MPLCSSLCLLGPHICRLGMGMLMHQCCQRELSHDNRRGKTAKHGLGSLSRECSDGAPQSRLQRLGLKFLFVCLATLDLSCSMWDLTSLTRDQTWAPSIGSTESSSLGHQQSPWPEDLTFPHHDQQEKWVHWKMWSWAQLVPGIPFSFIVL